MSRTYAQSDILHTIPLDHLIPIIIIFVKYFVYIIIIFVVFDMFGITRKKKVAIKTSP